ncbi:SurA N-terminal domain-containing protein [Pseudoblastomonas halimionae]|uniref:Parvulin-like PPIase n=1 Tax=Alteriqipengyuania halimionae TaxID=1926630 RepID=A0A6I4U0X1_9SPHN|nr:SurA N-terminal domain-containing protein [Alteriqipengyuania halimionae]MXP09528.1 peptidylprolyl isomerase [Alteriqipengyuania halimionae]
MITLFRSFFQSKLGIGITLAFLGLIALAFASSDVANTGTFGGVAGGETVAEVGGTSIDTAELRSTVETAYNNERSQNPDLTMTQFIEEGGLERVLDVLIQGAALVEYGEKHGIVISKRLIDSEIASDSNFAGLDGNFSEAAYASALRQIGLSDSMYRARLRQSLVANQLLAPAFIGSAFSENMAVRYAGALRETRKGKVVSLPSALFAPDKDPTKKQLDEFYASNRDRFTIPERRVIRYVEFDASSLKDIPAPTAAEIRARYERDADQYRASESRSLTQLIAPTEQGAKAILAKVRNGQSLAAAAEGTGLSPSDLETERADYAEASNAAVAKAAFEAARGKTVGPLRSPLGWHIVTVDAINSTPARSLADVRDEIVATLAEEKKREAVNQFAEDVEDGFASGSTLAEVASELGAEVKRTGPALSDGRIYNTPDSVPEILNPVLSTVAVMEEDSDPILAEVVPGEKFLIFDVAEFTSAAPPPIADVKEQVTAAWRLERGSVAAKAAADKIMKAVRGGKDLDAALRSLEKKLPPIEMVDIPRSALTANSERVPPPIALMFVMAKDTIKKLAAPLNVGWFVVQLDDIVPADTKRDDPEVATFRTNLGRGAGQEYAEQIDNAIEAEIGVTRNENAIRAVIEQLSGSGR